MEHEKPNFFRKDGSIFAGAIFMSNRSTKRECLSRKLFGLPQSKAKFLKQVKAGMILFLFEHEERKLYGVFEATSDGALNIVPGAFRSTGQSYPAQILFKRIWICRALCEDEFRTAIAENYYSPNKFHFGLSYEQVTNLIRLFYSRKINVKQDEEPKIPYEIIERFENSAADKVSSTEVGTYARYESDEYGREGRQEITRQYVPPQSSMDIPVHYKINAVSMEHAVSGRGSNQVNLRAVEASTSYSQHSCSETVTFSHFPTRKENPATLEMDYEPLPRQSACHPANLDVVEVPYDPDVPEFSQPCITIIPRIQEADLIKSLHVGAQQNLLFECPDYIPLPEEPQEKVVDGENQNSVVGRDEYVYCIPSTCKKIPIRFHGSAGNADDDELGHYEGMNPDDYPVAVVDGRLHSDTDLSRTSVFFRLSRDRNVCNHETPDSSTGLSLEQLFSILAERRERWGIRKASEELMEWGGSEQGNCTHSAEFSDQSSGHQKKFTRVSLQHEERSNSDRYDGVTEMNYDGSITPFDYEQSEDVADESFELPFYNFRRRNTTGKCGVQDGPSTCNDVSASEAIGAKSKRRRILRPPLHQQEQNVKSEPEVKLTPPTKEETDATSVDGTEDYIPIC